ncbi:MAG: hypothetical protein AAF682_13110 [Planctomycetota bacterium]
MSRPLLALSLLAIAPLALGAATQERVKPRQASDFGTLVDTAKKAWGDKRYGACQTSLQEAVALVAKARGDAIRAALPGAPAGFQAEKPKKQDQAANPFLGALAATVGNVIEQRYIPDGGGQPIQVTVTADSPMLQMFQMWIANPAMLPAGSELIKYGPHNAVLKKEQNGRRLNLQIVVGGSLAEVRWPNGDEDALFAMWDQAAVDKLAGVLSR